MLQERPLADEENRTRDRRTGLSVLAGKDLTARERDVWRLMSAGCDDAEIAERLSLNSLTVRFHLANALTKLGGAAREEGPAWGRRARPAQYVRPENGLPRG